MSEWTHNSFKQSSGDGNLQLDSFITALSILVLINSVYVHGSTYSNCACYRVQIEIAALSALVYGILHAHSRNCDTTTHAIVNNLLCNGVLILIIQLCNAHTFSSLLAAVAEISKDKVWMLQFYVVLIMLLPWFPAYSIGMFLVIL
jgi:hypothetical protein